MRFTQTSLQGAWLIEPEPLKDERGFFARLVCETAFAEHGLNTVFVQQSVSWNAESGTLRGLHYQAAPYAEDKLVRVTRGAIFDVIVDLRSDSASFGQWFGCELSASNYRQLYIPKGFAHGFQTLVPDSEIHYQMTAIFKPEASKGIRWDDPVLAIQWPDAKRIIGQRDQRLPIWRQMD